MSEKDFYEKIGNWDFSQIKYVSENFTTWNYIEEIKKNIKNYSKVLDLGTADGKQIFENYPKCEEILGTDFSEAMINTANKNNEFFQRKDVHFKIMDNLKMDIPNDYFDLVTARHTLTDKKGIYNSLKNNGKLILRGVDKLDCWSLKMLFKQGQGYNDLVPISQKDYEETIYAGFKNVELIPIHIVEYYKTKQDLLALLLKTPIIQNDSWDYENFNMKILDEYINENSSEKGIKLIRRYYGIVAAK